VPQVRFASVNSGPIPSSPMLWSVLYLALRRLIDRSGCGSSSVTSQDVEIAFVRHQLNILRRQMRRPHLRPTNRAFLAAASRLLPRDRWASFMVTPQTLLSLAPRACAAEVDLPKEQRVRPSSNSPNPPAIVPSQSSQYTARQRIHPGGCVWWHEIPIHLTPSPGVDPCGIWRIWRRQSTPIRSVIAIRLVSCGFPRSPNGAVFELPCSAPSDTP
jgi:hypothetical protein